MTNFAYLNPDNFKKWMRSQDDFEANIVKQNLIGSSAETKLSVKRILNKMTLENGKASKVAKQFAEEGGSIKEIDGDEYLIEVSSGSFFINKKYVIV